MCIFANAAPESDEVTSLPGWPGELPSKIYSGFVSAGVDTQDGVTYNMHEQYFFVESENDPKNDPVIVWTNGGPRELHRTLVYSWSLARFRLIVTV